MKCSLQIVGASFDLELGSGIRVTAGKTATRTRRAMRASDSTRTKRLSPPFGYVVGRESGAMGATPGAVTLMDAHNRLDTVATK